LVGTEWHLVSYRNPGYAGPVPVHADSTMRLDGKGGYSALACNHIGGYASIDGRTVTFRPGTTTMMACRGEPDTLDRQVGATARGAVTWSIRAHILTLTNRNGHVLAYRVSRAPSARSEKWAR
jgi:heat shock protein HslJ